MKIKILSKERLIIIDDYFKIGGAPEPNSFCVTCNNGLFYYDRYDATFCAYCVEWITPNCGKIDCFYCNTRPYIPLKIKTLG